MDAPAAAAGVGMAAGTEDPAKHPGAAESAPPAAAALSGAPVDQGPGSVTSLGAGAGVGAGAGAEGSEPAGGGGGRAVLLQQARELAAQGQWGVCTALLERELLGSGEEGTREHTASKEPELLRLLVVAKTHTLAARHPAGTAAGVSALLHWAADRLGTRWVRPAARRTPHVRAVDMAGPHADLVPSAQHTLGHQSEKSTCIQGRNEDFRCLDGALGRPGPSLPAPEVRTWYRRLAALVHPDKCRTVVPEAAAAGAFQLLQRGCEALLHEVQHRGGPGQGTDLGGQSGLGGSGVGRKRGRGRDGDGDGEEGWDGDGVEAEGDGEAWWEAWWDGGAAAGRPTTCPTESDQEAELWGLSLQELDAEVAARQAQVLRPPPGSAAASLTLHARQKRLRVARSVLSERKAAVAAKAEAAGPAGWSGGREGGGGLWEDGLAFGAGSRGAGGGSNGGAGGWMA